MKPQKSQEKFPQFKNKKILIMGLGLHGGGVGAAKFFAQAGAKVTATDLRTKRDLQESINQLKNLPIKYILGKHREKDFKNADIIIRNPAVPDDSPYLKIAQKYKVPIDTDIGIFFELYPYPIIGVTGTRGKSTTATLIYEMLKTKYPNAVLAGNIRKSVLLELPRILHNINSTSPQMRGGAPKGRRGADTIIPIILELSSWQLEGMAKHKKAPHVAVITTIQPDHLNRHKGMKEYIAAKKLIFKYQTKDDFLFLNKDDKIVRGFANEAKSKIIFFSAKDVKAYKSHLLGEHNLINIAAAVKVAKYFGVGASAIKKILKNFQGLTGRIELVAQIKGVKYINDTCATTPDAAIAAINTLCNDKRLILIAGGADKNLDFKKLAQLIAKKVKALILLEGTATDRLKKTIRKELRIEKTNGMANAVQLATSYAKKGDIVLLSPACASFGMFRHEFERGKKFVQAVRNLKQ